MTMRDGGASTYVVGEIHLDPKGYLPKWVVNIFQKDWPINTFSALRKHVKKPDVTEHPALREW